MLPQSVTIDSSIAYVINGNTLQPKAEMLPENAEDKTVIRSGEDGSAATVDSSGLVKDIKPGLTKITAITVNGLKLNVKSGSYSKMLPILKDTSSMPYTERRLYSRTDCDIPVQILSS